ncbi:MAG: beta-ketoacyl synthase [Gramella sp.]|nr:beta-ketoacyl synthase [Christiangramia sp.]
MGRNYLKNDSIISPLGFGTLENLKALRNTESALKRQKNSKIFKDGYFAGLIDNNLIDSAFRRFADPGSFTKLDKLLILAIKQVLDSSDVDPCITGLIISTTKGNIDLLGNNKYDRERIFLWKMAQVVSEFFKFQNKPVVVSNACISGALAIKTAHDLIETGRFENVIVAGGDLVSDFVLSGFQSFQAISPEPCRPFSNDRLGVSLGEAAAAILIGPDDGKDRSKIRYIDAITANDANHISGPSKTGEGLYQSIRRLLDHNKIDSSQIDYLSAHGTATNYNDEMESIAFNRAGLLSVPVNSFKGYYGHTLGTSALIESILTKHSLLNNELFTSLNYTSSGVSENLNVIENHNFRELDLALKTASGFGGCNLAMLLKKDRL